MIKIGGVKPNALYVGEDTVSRVYYGEELVWENNSKIAELSLTFSYETYNTGKPQQENPQSTKEI